MSLEVIIPQDPQSFQVTNLTLVHISGNDASSFLQGQLTCDMKSLQDWSWIAGGYCNAQGKLISAFRLAKIDDVYQMLLPKLLAGQVIENLKKYAVFSNVDISEQTNKEFVAHWVENSNDIYSSRVEQQNEGKTWLLHKDLKLTIQDKLNNNIPNSEYNWEQAMFAIGWVDVPEGLAGTQLPQAFNLDINEGINFKKGCYIGQEAIARMHYRGKTKKRAVRFLGSCETLPSSEQTLQVKVGENWRRAGAILNSVRYHDGVVALIALVSADLEETAQCRVEGQDDSQFTRCPD